MLRYLSMLKMEIREFVSSQQYRDRDTINRQEEGDWVGDLDNGGRDNINRRPSDSSPPTWFMDQLRGEDLSVASVENFMMGGVNILYVACVARRVISI